MPNLFTAGGYKVYFWSNEGMEPIHVHVSKGKPVKDSTKIWLTRQGGCILANNDSRIPDKDINELIDIISAQYFMICSKWKEHFRIEKIQFYC